MHTLCSKYVRGANAIWKANEPNGRCYGFDLETFRFVLVDSFSRDMNMLQFGNGNHVLFVHVRQSRGLKMRCPKVQ